MKQATVTHTFEFETPLHLHSGHRNLGSTLVTGSKNLEATRRKSKIASPQGKKHTRRNRIPNA